MSQESKADDAAAPADDSSSEQATESATTTSAAESAPPPKKRRTLLTVLLVVLGIAVVGFGVTMVAQYQPVPSHLTLTYDGPPPAADQIAGVWVEFTMAKGQQAKPDWVAAATVVINVDGTMTVTGDYNPRAQAARPKPWQWQATYRADDASPGDYIVTRDGNNYTMKREGDAVTIDWGYLGGASRYAYRGAALPK